MSDPFPNFAPELKHYRSNRSGAITNFIHFDQANFSYLVRTIDFSSTGTAGIGAIEYFEDSSGGGGRFFVLGGFGRAFVTDLDGNSRNVNGFLFGEFNLRVKLGLITRNDIAAITSGPLAGAFAVTDGSGGEIVIFRLD